MPTTVKVKVNTVNHTKAVSQAGNDLNYVELTGFCPDTNKGFKKRFFATQRNGTATPEAELADTLQKNDWVEVTMDDSSYKNVEGLKKIAEPAGMTAPDQEQKPNTFEGLGTTRQPPKASRTTGQINREKALDAALKYLAIRGVMEGHDNAKMTLELAKKFEAYLVTDISHGPKPVVKNTVVPGEDSELMLMQEQRDRAEADEANAEISF